MKKACFSTSVSSPAEFVAGKRIFEHPLQFTTSCRTPYQGNRTKIRFNENQSHNCHFVAFSEDVVTKSEDVPDFDTFILTNL
jgi:hypothetical protein